MSENCRRCSSSVSSSGLVIEASPTNRGVLVRNSKTKAPDVLACIDFPFKDEFGDAGGAIKRKLLLLAIKYNTVNN
jgi:hypothetical protein